MTRPPAISCRPTYQFHAVVAKNEMQISRGSRPKRWRQDIAREKRRLTDPSLTATWIKSASVHRTEGHIRQLRGFANSNRSRQES